jgi:hypothetical protein
MRRLSGDAKPPPLELKRPSKLLYSRAPLCALIFGPTIPAAIRHPQLFTRVGVANPSVTVKRR